MEHRSYANYPIRLEGAALFASLEGIKNDLFRVAQYCRYLHDHGVFKLDFLVWEAMSVAAVIAYARCFGPGVRAPLPKDFFDQAPYYLLAAHEHFIALRSKHIAHSVNAYEENIPSAQVGSHFQSAAEIEHLHVTQSRVIGLATDEPEKLLELVAWANAKIELMVAEEKAKLLPLVQSCDLEQLRQRGTWQPTRSDRSAVKVRRSLP
jgi:hypothetical protein